MRETLRSSVIAEEQIDAVVVAIKQQLARVRRKLRHSFCFLFGGHELYRAHSETKLYQCCLLCGYETKGWTIDRRDRRLHFRK